MKQLFFKEFVRDSEDLLPSKGENCAYGSSHTYILSWHFEKDGCQMDCNWMSCVSVSLKTGSYINLEFRVIYNYIFNLFNSENTEVIYSTWNLHSLV